MPCGASGLEQAKMLCYSRAGPRAGLEARSLEGTTAAAPADLMPYWWGTGRAQQPLLRDLLAPNCLFLGRESELA